MPTQRFEVGDRVRYLGNSYPHLMGKSGVITIPTSSKILGDFASVRFDGKNKSVRIGAYDLEKIYRH